jgi:hypothetical protein
VLRGRAALFLQMIGHRGCLRAQGEAGGPGGCSVLSTTWAMPDQRGRYRERNILRAGPFIRDGSNTPKLASAWSESSGERQQAVRSRRAGARRYGLEVWRWC